MLNLLLPELTPKLRLIRYHIIDLLGPFRTVESVNQTVAVGMNENPDWSGTLTFTSASSAPGDAGLKLGSVTYGKQNFFQPEMCGFFNIEFINI